MNIITKLLLGCLSGLKDSVLGIIALTKIDNDDNEKDSRPPSRRGTRPRSSDKKYVYIIISNL